jgi:hypothetical protein
MKALVNAFSSTINRPKSPLSDPKAVMAWIPLIEGLGYFLSLEDEPQP